MKKWIPVLALLMTLSFAASAGTVDSIVVRSEAMQKDFGCVVIKPSNYKKSRQNFPVVYLLHGYGGWFSNWIIRVPALKDYADRYQLLIVCPEGKNSWYIDSPMDTASRFETYIGKELIAYIDAHYRTIPNRRGRAITGLSMGGHGALYLATRNQPTFGACGSMSGGVDVRPFPKSWELPRILGDTIKQADYWYNYAVIHVMERYHPDSTAILFDCGTEDFFSTVNRQLHQRLLELKIAHDYIERPGKHDWAYWSNAVEYQFLFLRKYFDRNQK